MGYKNKNKKVRVVATYHFISQNIYYVALLNNWTLLLIKKDCFNFSKKSKIIATLRFEELYKKKGRYVIWKCIYNPYFRKRCE